MNLILFYINLGISVIFDIIFFSQKISEINKRTPMFIPESRVLVISKPILARKKINAGINTWLCTVSNGWRQQHALLGCEHLVLDEPS